ncbi:MAG TPA: CorA family divalent cation transporter [Solirubrobacterales bacterium]|nr:CorA family divalent cation transporter [Solirubrobacterales bacterium]
MSKGAAETDVPIPVFPVCATIWPAEGRGEWETIEDLTDRDALERLRTAAGDGTVWVEARVDVDDDEGQRKWLEGEYPVWDALPTPRVYWRPMGEVLEALGLRAPPPQRVARELASSRLLRALPFAYSRGAFGTVRDALSEQWVVDELVRLAGGDPLTAFPSAGFKPGNSESDSAEVLYTVLHAAVGVVGNTVVSARLPDTFCPALAAGRAHVSPRKLVPAEVLTRFLPQGRTASGREVAEAIGMHQATSARAVAFRIRGRLKGVERLAERLGDESALDGDEKPEFKLQVDEAAKKIDALAEVAQQLDRTLSTILRRFSGEISGSPEAVQELVPPETKRRYSFALDNVRALHDDCRLASQIVSHELASYEHSQRERFQFIAAVLASVVLIPTLIASILGVNLGVPGEHSRVGFVAFVVAIGGLCAVGYAALRTAETYDWSPPSGQLRGHLGAAAAILVALVIVLLLVS